MSDVLTDSEFRTALSGRVVIRHAGEIPARTGHELAIASHAALHRLLADEQTKVSLLQAELEAMTEERS